MVGQGRGLVSDITIAQITLRVVGGASRSVDHMVQCSCFCGVYLYTHTWSSYLISSFQFRVKLAENLFQLFSDHVSENVQATPERQRAAQEGQGQGQGQQGVCTRVRYL